MADEIEIVKPRRQRQTLLTLNADSGERHASWLELFFDLVFVLAVSKVALILVKESDLVGFAKFIFLFIPVWWAWVGYTFYGDRFESNEPEYRILMFAAMLAVAALSLTVGNAFTPGGGIPFVICYALVLLILCAMYARTAIHVPLARGLAMQFVTGLGGAAVIFLLSLFFDGQTRFVMWCVGVLLTLATPFINLRLTRIIPIDHSHIPERFGLFTIIVLGEAVIATANGAADVPWNFTTIGTASLGFAMAACIWWLNFEFVEDDAIKQPGILPRFTYLYGHFFIVASIITIGIGVEHAIIESGEPHLHTPALVLLGGGITAYLATITLIRKISGVCSLVWIRVLAILLCLGITAAGMILPPMATVGALLAVLIGSVLLEARFTDDEEEAEEMPRMLPCAHDEMATTFNPRSDAGCEECVKNNYKWVHLRLCLTCGHVGCCDSSKFTHATKHFHEDGHPLMASLEPGENWSWCYLDERYVPLAEPVGKLQIKKLESEETK